LKTTITMTNPSTDTTFS